MNKPTVDYIRLLSETIAELPDNNPRARSLVYERARDIVRQNALTPGVPTYAASVEKVALEAAIRRVDAQWSDGKVVEALVQEDAADAEACAPEPTAYVAASEPAEDVDAEDEPDWAAAPAAHERAEPLVAFDPGPVRPVPPPALSGRAAAGGAVAIPRDRLAVGPLGRALRIEKPRTAAARSSVASPTRLIRLAGALLITAGIVAFGVRHARQVSGDAATQRTAVPVVARSPTSNTPADAAGTSVDAAASSQSDPAAGNACGAGGGEACANRGPDLAAAPTAAAPSLPPVVSRPPPRSQVTAAQTAFEAGLATSKTANTSQAVNEFGQAIKLDPSFAEAYLSRGLLYFRSGNMPGALADFNDAVRLSPQHALALKSRAMVHVYKNETDLAIADFTRALAVTAADKMRLSGLDTFYARRGRAALYDMKQLYDSELGDLTAIVDAYRKDPLLQAEMKDALGETGGTMAIAGIYQLRAGVQAKKGRNDQALSDLSTAIDLYGARASVALVQRGRLYEATGRKAEAAADYRRALALEPERQDARAALAHMGP